MSRHCPCCGADSDSRIPLHKVTLAPIEGVTVINDYEVVQCAVCGMCYAAGIPSQHEVSAYYAAASKYTTVSASDRKRHEITATHMRACLNLPPDAKILDVGAGAGGLSHALAPLTVVGTDVLDGLTALQLARTHGGFDGVILSGVLEHVVDVRSLLERIRYLVKQDGCLWIEVPDAGGWHIAGHLSAPFQEFSSEHINYFTADSLRLTLRNAGFDLAGFDLGGIAEQTPTQSAAHLVGWFRPRDLVDARASIDLYIADSTARLDRYIAAANNLPSPCIIWGAGTLTRRLWPQLKDKVLYVIDSNPAYHGHDLDGVDIISPAQAVLLCQSFPIVACTQGAVDAIQADAQALGMTAVALLDYAKP